MGRTPRTAALALWLLAASARAEAPEDAPAAELSIAGRVVFVFRSERAGYSPVQRLTAARALLEELVAGDQDVPVTHLSLPEGERILVRGKEAFSVLATDVDSLAGETLETLVADTVERLAVALGEVREGRSWHGLLLATGKSVATLLVAAGLVWLLLRNQRNVQARLGRIGHERGVRPGASDLRILWEQNTVPLARGLATMLTWGLVALVVFLGFERLLLNFPYSRPIGESLQGQLLGELGQLLLAIVHSLPGLAVAILIWLAARFGIGMVRRYFQAAARGQVRSHLADAVTPLVAERLVAALVWLAALVVAFPYIPGSSTGAFQGVSVFAGLMVSLGSTSLVGQMASGIVLAYSRAFRVGDHVRFGEHEGTVVAFTLLATKLRTNKNEEVSVPNSLFTAGTTVNYTRFARDEGTYLATQLSLGYDIPWRKVHELLLGAARRTEGLAGEPAPHVLQTALSDFYIQYELRAVAHEPARRAAVLSLLHANVLDDFEAAGVAILSPHHTHLHGSVARSG